MWKIDRRQFYVEVFIRILNVFFFAKIRMWFKHKYSKDKFIYGTSRNFLSEFYRSSTFCEFVRSIDFTISLHRKNHLT